MANDIMYLTQDLDRFRYSEVPLKFGLAMEITDEIRYAVLADSRVAADSDGYVCHPVGHPNLPILLSADLLVAHGPLQECRYCGIELGVPDHHHKLDPDPIGTGHAHRHCLHDDVDRLESYWGFEPSEVERILKTREETAVKTA